MRKNDSGVAMLEFLVVFVVVALVIVFTFDAALSMSQFSRLSRQTAVLTRELATDLGRAWSTAAVAASPFNGSCNAYLRDRAAAALTESNHSASDSNAKFYFGSTFDDSSAIVFDGSSPYAILRVRGELAPPCMFCVFFPSAIASSESSALIEYDTKNCADY